MTLRKIFQQIRGNLSAPAARVLVINDTRDQSNWGSQSLVDALVTIITDSVPGVQLDFIPSYDLFAPSAVRTPPAMLLPSVADQYEVVAREWLAGRGGAGAEAFMRQAREANAVILNGEGSIYRNNHSAIKGMYMLWFAKTQLGRPAAFLNGGVHLTLVHALLPAMVRKTFGAVDAVAVREPYSWRSLAEYAPAVKATIIPDSVFYMTPHWASLSERPNPLAAELKGQPYFCVSGGQMPYDYQYGDRSALQGLIKALKQLALQAVLVAKEPDDQYLAQVAQETNSIFFGPEHNYQELLAVLANAQFQLGSRYHHIIMASAVGCPSIAFGALSHKVHGLCELLDGLVGKPYDSTDIGASLDAIKAQAAGYMQAGPELRQKLRAQAAQLGRDTRAIGFILQSLLPAPVPSR